MSKYLTDALKKRREYYKKHPPLSLNEFKGKFTMQDDSQFVQSLMMNLPLTYYFNSMTELAKTDGDREKISECSAAVSEILKKNCSNNLAYSFTKNELASRYDLEGIKVGEALRFAEKCFMHKIAGCFMPKNGKEIMEQAGIDLIINLLVIPFAIINDQTKTKKEKES